MKITAKKLEEYSKKELQDKRFEISSELINAWVTTELKKMYRKDRIKKIEDQKYNIERIIAINALLWETWDRNDMYLWFLNDLEWEND